MTDAVRAAMLRVQRAELTEFHIYSRLARRMRHDGNRELLERIAGDERRHHDFWRALTERETRPSRVMIVFYSLLARLFGLTFALKLMERGEDFAQHEYRRLQHIEGVDRIIEDEEEHETRLLDLLKDEPLEYAGSIVLGLNDALVELTGALAGFTLALGEGRVVAVAGLVTGIAASLSMAASEYLSSRSEDVPESEKHPLKAAAYTGIAYIGAVILLILPFFLADSVFVALGFTLLIAVVIIAVFNFYISVAKELRFWVRFAEMAAISLGVAAISFGIAWVLRGVFGIEA